MSERAEFLPTSDFQCFWQFLLTCKPGLIISPTLALSLLLSRSPHSLVSGCSCRLLFHGARDLCTFPYQAVWLPGFPSSTRASCSSRAGNPFSGLWPVQCSVSWVLPFSNMSDWLWVSLSCSLFISILYLCYPGWTELGRRDGSSGPTSPLRPLPPASTLPHRHHRTAPQLFTIPSGLFRPCAPGFYPLVKDLGNRSVCWGLPIRFKWMKIE